MGGDTVDCLFVVFAEILPEHGYTAIVNPCSLGWNRVRSEFMNGGFWMHKGAVSCLNIRDNEPQKASFATGVAF
jgi:hypothetical protein